MRILAIGGEPGSGKTTLMNRVLETLKPEPKYDQVKLVPYLQAGHIHILGKYEPGEVFAGTDRMSMAVQPEAVKFLQTLHEDSVVLFEGDRLFNSSFLSHCDEQYDLSIIYLSTDRHIRASRYAERGSNQDETWLRGRESKIANILGNLVLMWKIETFGHNNLEEQQVILERIKDFTNGK
jgi:GTPase SAR1 family protein